MTSCCRNRIFCWLFSVSLLLKSQQNCTSNYQCKWNLTPSNNRFKSFVHLPFREFQQQKLFVLEGWTEYTEPTTTIKSISSLTQWPVLNTRNPSLGCAALWNVSKCTEWTRNITDMDLCHLRTTTFKSYIHEKCCEKKNSDTKCLAKKKRSDYFGGSNAEVGLYLWENWIKVVIISFRVCEKEQLSTQ